MKNKTLLRGMILLLCFGLWTLLILTVDVKPLGVNGTDIGFATPNLWFHQLTGIHMSLYTITDWMGLIPVFVCIGFAGLGLWQWVKRKSLLKVDRDILLLGVYYIVVIVCYLAFEMVPVNCRPVLIEGMAEASYPSSTTLLVLGVMPTLVFQIRRRIGSESVTKTVCKVSYAFAVFMVAARLISGVHWLTDIVGAVLLSGGLFLVYKGTVRILDGKESEKKIWNWEKNCKNSEREED